MSKFEINPVMVDYMSKRKCNCGDDAVACLDGEWLCEIHLVARVFEKTGKQRHEITEGVLIQKIEALYKDKLGDGEHIAYNQAIDDVLDLLKHETKPNVQDKHNEMEQIKTIKYLHDACQKCGGHGYWVDNNEKKIICDACNGTGKRIVIGNKEGEL